MNPADMKMECLRLAIESLRHVVATTTEILAAAKAFEDYVSGQTDPAPEKLRAA